MDAPMQPPRKRRRCNSALDDRDPSDDESEECYAMLRSLRAEVEEDRVLVNSFVANFQQRQQQRVDQIEQLDNWLRRSDKKRIKREMSRTKAEIDALEHSSRSPPASNQFFRRDRDGTAIDATPGSSDQSHAPFANMVDTANPAWGNNSRVVVGPSGRNSDASAGPAAVSAREDSSQRWRAVRADHSVTASTPGSRNITSTPDTITPPPSAGLGRRMSYILKLPVSSASLRRIAEQELETEVEQKEEAVAQPTIQPAVAPAVAVPAPAPAFRPILYEPIGGREQSPLEPLWGDEIFASQPQRSNNAEVRPLPKPAQLPADENENNQGIAPAPIEQTRQENVEEIEDDKSEDIEIPPLRTHSPSLPARHRVPSPRSNDRGRTRQASPTLRALFPTPPSPKRSAPVPATDESESDCEFEAPPEEGPSPRRSRSLRRTRPSSPENSPSPPPRPPHSRRRSPQRRPPEQSPSPPPRPPHSRRRSPQRRPPSPPAPAPTTPTRGRGRVRAVPHPRRTTSLASSKGPLSGPSPAAHPVQRREASEITLPSRPASPGPSRNPRRTLRANAKAPMSYNVVDLCKAKFGDDDGLLIRSQEDTSGAFGSDGEGETIRVDLTPSKKAAVTPTPAPRRGRPKGSRNKLKTEAGPSGKKPVAARDSNWGGSFKTPPPVGSHSKSFRDGSLFGFGFTQSQASREREEERGRLWEENRKKGKGKAK